MSDDEYISDVPTEVYYDPDELAELGDFGFAVLSRTPPGTVRVDRHWQRYLTAADSTAFGSPIRNRDGQFVSSITLLDAFEEARGDANVLSSPRSVSSGQMGGSGSRVARTPRSLLSHTGVGGSSSSSRSIEDGGLAHTPLHLVRVPSVNRFSTIGFMQRSPERQSGRDGRVPEQHDHLRTESRHIWRPRPESADRQRNVRRRLHRSGAQRPSERSGSGVSEATSEEGFPNSGTALSQRESPRAQAQRQTSQGVRDILSVDLP